MVRISSSYRKFIVLLATLVLTACASGSESFVYTPADEPEPGPGLFSGPDGAFTIYKSSAEDDSREQEEKLQ
jgi:hypothetical protein